jgi:hypothetical protein
MCKNITYILQKPTPKIRQSAIQLAISQLFQKLKSRSTDKHGLSSIECSCFKRTTGGHACESFRAPRVMSGLTASQSHGQNLSLFVGPKPVGPNGKSYAVRVPCVAVGTLAHPRAGGGFGYSVFVHSSYSVVNLTPLSCLVEI